jgi:hypothetical protein
VLNSFVSWELWVVLSCDFRCNFTSIILQSHVAWGICGVSFSDLGCWVLSVFFLKVFVYPVAKMLMKL